MFPHKVLASLSARSMFEDRGAGEEVSVGECNRPDLQGRRQSRHQHVGVRDMDLGVLAGDNRPLQVVDGFPWRCAICVDTNVRVEVSEAMGEL